MHMLKNRKKRRILLVDDDSDVCFMIDLSLRRMGYLVAARTNPLDALALFSRAPERFDGVIIDQMMPELMGTHLAKQLIRVKDDIPIILITGHGDEVSLDEVRQSGVRATIVKPVLRDQLRITLERLLEPA